MATARVALKEARAGRAVVKQAPRGPQGALREARAQDLPQGPQKPPQQDRAAEVALRLRLRRTTLLMRAHFARKDIINRWRVARRAQLRECMYAMQHERH